MSRRESTSVPSRSKTISLGAGAGGMKNPITFGANRRYASARTGFGIIRQVSPCDNVGGPRAIYLREFVMLVGWWIRGATVAVLMLAAAGPASGQGKAEHKGDSSGGYSAIIDNIDM